MLLLLASLVTVKLPLAAPLAIGENAMVRVKVLPASIENGTAGGVLREKPVPETATFETLAVPAPEFVTVKVADFATPRATLPRSKLAGLAESIPRLVPPPPNPPGVVPPLLDEGLDTPVPPAQPIKIIVPSNMMAR
jgi:hypothetical protein